MSANKEYNPEPYLKWESDINEWAHTEATSLIDDFNNGYKSKEYTMDSSKPVTEYSYMKVWHILSGSGIFLSVRIRLVNYKCRIILSMTDQSPDLIN